VEHCTVGCVLSCSCWLLKGRAVNAVLARAYSGWSSGAMVARYVRALTEELAVGEFERSWELRQLGLVLSLLN
jgi:hypothetical protein